MNEIDEMLNYAIDKFSEALENENYYEVVDGVCQVLWDRYKFPNIDVSKISKLGRNFTADIAKKYNLGVGNMWWFYGQNEEIQAKARLEVLKLIRDERISRGKELEG